MKEGSTVVVLPLPGDVSQWGKDNDVNIKWMPVCNGEDRYMVREISNHKTTGPLVYFEEGVIGVSTDGKEVGICIDYVKEVEPPLDIEELMMQTEFAEL